MFKNLEDRTVVLPHGACGLRSLFTFKVVLEGGEEVADDRDAPGATQDPLPLAAAHVVHVCVVFREAKDSATTQKKQHTNH